MKARSDKRRKPVEKREHGEIDESGSKRENRVSSRERPSKSRRKSSNEAEDMDDPVAMARKALEMFKKEVEDDGDYTEPDTAPGQLDSPGRMIDQQKEKIPVKKDTKISSEDSGNTAKRGSTQQKTTNRIAMFSDDPSIL